MGRSGRSRKRKDAMNRVKRERNAKKELARLKVIYQYFVSMHNNDNIQALQLHCRKHWDSLTLMEMTSKWNWKKLLK